MIAMYTAMYSDDWQKLNMVLVNLFNAFQAVISVKPVSTFSITEGLIDLTYNQ